MLSITYNIICVLSVIIAVFFTVKIYLIIKDKTLFVLFALVEACAWYMRLTHALARGRARADYWPRHIF